METYTLQNIREECLKRLRQSTTSPKIWSLAKVDNYVNSAQIDIVKRTKCLWGMHVLEVSEDSKTFTLPSGVIEIPRRRVIYNENNHLDFYTLNQIQEEDGDWEDADSATPRYWFQKGQNTIWIHPPADTEGDSCVFSMETGALLGAELLTDGDCSSDSFTKGTGWTYDSTNEYYSCGTHTGATGLTQSISIASGSIYRVKYTISSRTGGQSLAAIGTSYSSLSPLDGSFTHDVTATQTGSIACGVAGNVSFLGIVDDISIKLLSSETMSSENIDDLGIITAVSDDSEDADGDSGTHTFSLATGAQIADVDYGIIVSIADDSSTDRHKMISYTPRSHNLGVINDVLSPVGNIKINYVRKPSTLAMNNDYPEIADVYYYSIIYYVLWKAYEDKTEGQNIQLAKVYMDEYSDSVLQLQSADLGSKHTRQTRMGVI